MPAVSRRTRLTALVAAAGMALATWVPMQTADAVPDVDLSWDMVESPVQSSIRALDVVSDDVVWAATDGGEVVRTTDGGATWDSVPPQDSGGLLFRDVEAFDDDRAVLLAIGEGEASRIFVTDDGGQTWDETFRNPEPAGFYNCLAFWTPKHGIATGDPIDGVFRVLTTDDGGQTWQRVPDNALPPAEGEFGFSASGSCVTVAGGTNAWFGTGGADARVFHTDDRGRSWEVTDTPLRASDAGGVFTLAFRTPRHGVILGGDFLEPDVGTAAAATTDDGGETWEAVADDDAPSGYRSGSAWVTGLPHTVIAVGPNGSDVSRDGGESWTTFSDTGFHVVDCSRNGVCWAAGSDGRIARLITQR